MRDFVFAFSLFTATLFFSITAILGIDYSGGASSHLYQYYCVTTSVIAFLTFFFCYVPQKKTIRNIITFFVLIVYFFVGVFSGFVSDKSFLCFCAFCIPSSCVGIYYANAKDFSSLVKWLDVFLLLISVSLIFLMMKLSASISAGTSNYSQSLSYVSALCFLLDLFLLGFGGQFKRFHLFTTRVYKVFCYLLLAFYPVAILYSGGRGGFVVFILGLLVYLFISSRKKGQTVLLVGGVLLLFGVGSYLITRGFGTSQFLSDIQRNSARVFSYVSSEGIDMSETSSRDFVYTISLGLIRDNPFGYGLFNYKHLFRSITGQPYPHNLFLEWLIQGGVIFFIVWIGVIIAFIVKISRLIKHGLVSPVLCPLIIYPFVHLLFSSSYMEEPFFWFSLTYVFNYPIQRMNA